MLRKLLSGKAVGLLIVLLALFMAVGVAGEERTDASGQWKYVLEDGSAMITGSAMDGITGALLIPRALDGYAVTGIKESEFILGEITDVIIPDSVMRIVDWAFTMEKLTRENGVQNVLPIPAFDAEGTVVIFSETEKNDLERLFSAANPSDLLISFDFGDNIDHTMWVTGFAACYRDDETSSDFGLFSEDAETHFADLWAEYFDGWNLLEGAIPPEDILPYSITGTVRDSIYYRAKNETMQSLIKGIYGREMADPEDHIRYYDGYFYFGHIGDYEERLWFGYNYTVDTVYELSNGYYKIEGAAALYSYADGELEDTKVYEALVQKDPAAKYTYLLIAQRFSE